MEVRSRSTRLIGAAIRGLGEDAVFGDKRWVLTLWQWKARRRDGFTGFFTGSTGMIQLQKELQRVC